MLNEPFAHWLAREMQVRQLSQRRLAQLAGLDHSTISRLVIGRSDPSLRTTKLIIRALHSPGQHTRPLPGFTLDTAGSPGARVEHALRSDPNLSAYDIRDILTLYHKRRRPRTEQQQVVKIDGKAKDGTLLPRNGASGY